jgi:hypothetical protein
VQQVLGREACASTVFQPEAGRPAAFPQAQTASVFPPAASDALNLDALLLPEVGVLLASASTHPP